jgi:hypothetical protein
MLIIKSGHSTVFASDAIEFHLDDSDSDFIKVVKMELLSELAVREPAVAVDVVEELCWAARNDSATEGVQISAINCLLVTCLGQSSFDSGVSLCLESLLLPEISSDVISSALCALREISRRFPNGNDTPAIQVNTFSIVSQIQLSGEGQAALLWFVGRFPVFYPSAPAYVQSLVSNWINLDSKVKLELLPVTLQVFLSRPSETLGVLSELWRLVASDDDDDLDLVDQVMFFSGVLKSGGMEKLRAVISAPSDVSCAQEPVSIAQHFPASFNSLISIVD